MTGKIEVIVGIDEAGRGPVMGPMVYGIAALPITTNETKILEKYGANDSKQLTDEKRRSILAKLKTIPDFYYAAEAVSAEQISFQMNQPNKISLNQIAFLAARKLLEEVHKRYKIVHVYIDLISPAQQYEQFLKQTVNVPMTIVAKADATYPITGAASIVAKVTRDDFIPPNSGSGYPGDAATLKYLASIIDPLYGFGSAIRYSWKTIKEMEKTGKLHSCQWFSNDSDCNQKNTQENFFESLGFKL